MKKGAKLGVGLVVLLIILVVTATIAVKVLVTPERVKGFVVPLAEEHLQRKVLLGDVEISLFSGIQLKDFAVRNRADSADFVATDALVLTYQFLPLLSGRVVVDEVRLVNPRIRIERLEDGSFNFSDLIPAEGEEGGATEPPSPVDTPETGGGGIPLQLAEANLVNGTVEFIDRHIDPKTPYRLRLEKIVLLVTDLAPGQTARVKAGATLNGGTFSLGGQVSPADQTFDLQLELDGLDLVALRPYFQQQLPGTLDSLILALDLGVKGSATAFETAGTVEGRDLSLRLEALPDAPLDKARIRLEHKATINPELAVATLKQVNLRFNEIEALASGTVSQWTTEPQVDLQVALPQQPIADLLGSLPAGLVQPATQFKPGGGVAVDLVLNGAVSEPKKLLQSGVLTLAGVTGRVAGYQPLVDGRLRLQGMALTSDGLVAQVAGQKMNLDLQVDDLLAQPLKGTVALQSDRLSLTALKNSQAEGPEKVPAVPKGKESPAKGEKTTEELGPYDIPVDLKGTIRVGEVDYNKVVATNLVTDFTLRKNILTVDPVKAEVGEGTVGGKARVNLGVKGLAYSSDIGIQQVAIEKVIHGFWPKLAGAVLGRISLDLAGEGKGTQWDAMKKTLQGKGQLQILQGKLGSSALTRGLVEQTKIKELETLNFSQIAMNFLVEKGRLSLGGKADGKEARLAPEGKIGLDGALDMNLGLKMAPELADKAAGGKLGNLLRDKEGWAAVPLKLAGTVTKPQVLLDEKALQKQVLEKGKQKLKKKLEEKVLDKVLKTPEPSSEDSESTSDPKKQLLEKGLKELFGR